MVSGGGAAAAGERSQMLHSHKTSYGIFSYSQVCANPAILIAARAAALRVLQRPGFRLRLFFHLQTSRIALRENGAPEGQLMATSPSLIAAIAKATRRRPEAVAILLRHIRLDGGIGVGGRGPYALQMTPADAVKLSLGVLYGGQFKDSMTSIKKYEVLPRIGDDPIEQRWTTFGQAFETVLRDSGTGGESAEITVYSPIMAATVTRVGQDGKRSEIHFGRNVDEFGPIEADGTRPDYFEARRLSSPAVAIIAASIAPTVDAKRAGKTGIVGVDTCSEAPLGFGS